MVPRPTGTTPSSKPSCPTMDELLHLVTIGPQEDYDLSLGLAVLLCLNVDYQADVLVLCPSKED